MARYAKIDRRMHADEKYRRLSAPPPCGQALWWHLLAGRQTGIIPGLYTVGEAAFAEQVGWPLKGFREAFREVLREGMVEADWESHLVWVPKAIRYNPPASPNVVMSWRDSWDELPECELKTKAWQSLKAFIEGMGKGFREAFAKACPNPSGKTMANQEQEQEQEQEKNPPHPPKGGEELAPIPEVLDTPEFRAAWADWLQHRRERRPKVTPTAARGALAELAALGPARAVVAIRTSIAKGWQGIFESRGPPTPANGAHSKPTREDEIRDALRAYREKQAREQASDG